jgi:hypothetical protein
MNGTHRMVECQNEVVDQMLICEDEMILLLLSMLHERKLGHGLWH